MPFYLDDNRLFDGKSTKTNVLQMYSHICLFYIKIVLHQHSNATLNNGLSL